MKQGLIYVKSLKGRMHAIPVDKILLIEDVRDGQDEGRTKLRPREEDGTILEDGTSTKIFLLESDEPILVKTEFDIVCTNYQLMVGHSID